MAETRVRNEGSLRIVRASGSGRTWATASAPVSALMGYVEGFNFTSGREVMVVSERGVPDHQKFTKANPIDVALDFLWTGIYPTAISGSGATMPMFHLEYRASAAEIGAGIFYQFLGVSELSHQVTEGDPTKVSLKFQGLALTGPTGSGYLS